MAREGLRTLVVAKKTLSEDQYRDFEVCHHSTNHSITSAFRHTKKFDFSQLVTYIENL